MSSKHVPRIAILMDTATTWSRTIIEGIGRYTDEHGSWDIFLEPRGFDQPHYVPDGWQVEGVIARIHQREMYERLAKRNIPVVNVSNIRIKGIETPRVVPDEPAFVRMGMDHLLGLGLKHFAYCGDPGRIYTAQRIRTFGDTIREMAGECHIYRRGKGVTARSSWREQLADRGRWLQSLPKPVGVITWGVTQARRVSDACRMIDIHVPEEVAIVSVDYDDLINTMSRPALTGLRWPTRRQGYMAASLLDRMMRGEKVSNEPILLQPLGVAPRESTDMLAVSDHRLRQALRYIREHACEGIDVGHVLKNVPMARRTLERRFVYWVGRSPAAEIRRLRLERARQLLTDTTIPIADIASAAGWKYVEHMIPAFKDAFGQTPLQYRKRTQTGR